MKKYSLIIIYAVVVAFTINIITWYFYGRKLAPQFTVNTAVKIIKKTPLHDNYKHCTVLIKSSWNDSLPYYKDKNRFVSTKELNIEAEKKILSILNRKLNPNVIIVENSDTVDIYPYSSQRPGLDFIYKPNTPMYLYSEIFLEARANTNYYAIKGCWLVFTWILLDEYAIGGS